MKLFNNPWIKLLKRNITSFSLLIMFFLPLNLFAQSYTQDMAKTEVKFRVKNMGIYIKGKFNASEFSVNFDKENLASSSINAKISIGSLETGIKKRDKDLKKKKFFDIEKFTIIEFQSTSFKKIAEGNYTMTGELTIKGTSKTVEMSIDVVEESNSISISTIHNLDRKDYKVGGNSWVMSDRVEIDVVYVGKGQ